MKAKGCPAFHKPICTERGEADSGEARANQAHLLGVKPTMTNHKGPAPSMETLASGPRLAKLQLDLACIKPLPETLALS